MMDAVSLILWFVAVNFGCVVSEISLKFVFVIEGQEIELTREIANSIRSIEKSRLGVKISDQIIDLNRENEDESFRKLCSSLNSVSAILELTWHPWTRLQELSDRTGLPVIRSLLGHQQAVMALHQYLEFRNATDVAMLLGDEYEVDQTLYHLLGSTNVRIWVHAGMTKDTARALQSMRPEPGFHAVIGDAVFVGDTYHRAIKEKLVRRRYRWNLVLTDYSEPTLDMNYELPTMLLTMDPEECCLLMMKEECSCPGDFQRKQYILTALLDYLASTFEKVANNLSSSTAANINCESMEFSSEMNNTRNDLFTAFREDGDGNNNTLFYFDEDKSALYLRTRFILTSYSPQDGLVTVTAWRADEQFNLLPNSSLPPLKQFFRIGVAPAVPWTMPKVDTATGEPMFDAEGNPVYEGYCIDLIEKLAQAMNLDYELVTPKVGTFGQRLPNGTWDGVVGDLMTGETDFAVAALTMTAEREEVIDFVAPYFEQTGILIVIRNPIRKTSLFKFMTVLRTEVWFSIVGALVLTGVMIWFLDKYSPYSARNNKEAYPYPCREFTLKESFWFALTSFTPQGGGEAPKALSGRTLVAAYWLFVVLMLATFTANLAAFLTVERMQTPVSSLEQLARQSRINYTVVEGSPTHQYFMNMKFAEDTLYRVWKEITLNATSDQAQYRVWDYPIKEQYGHILLAINASVPVRDAKEGFQEVNDHADADFAFIHDSAEIKYEITRNCNLTEVGEIFAEQPYAIAVQQGSRLQEDLSRILLDLQKERFLEQLSSKYWNETARRSCPDADESEGITLESLGGVFIATLFGLGLAMITLAWEVFYYKRKEKNQIQSLDAHVEKPPFAAAGEKKKSENKMAALKFRKKNGGKKKEGLNKSVTIGDSFMPVSDKNKVSFINVYPKERYQN